jgi:hypothetical protein
MRLPSATIMSSARASLRGAPISGLPEIDSLVANSLVANSLVANSLVANSAIADLGASLGPRNLSQKQFGLVGVTAQRGR